MRRQRFRNLAMMLLAALVLTSASQAWAIIGTQAGETISNTASVSFTINGNTTSKTSDAAVFVVDRKIRPIVANLDTGNSVVVVAGAQYVYLSFSVTNESNTASGSDFFKLTIEDGARTLNMLNVQIWDGADADSDGVPDALEDNDSNGDPDGTALGTEAVVSINNDLADNDKTYLIVANTPTGVIPVLSDTFHLVATAWDGATLGDSELLQDQAAGTTLNTNDHDESEIVFADDSGTAPSGDNGLDNATTPDGKHSDQGTFSLEEPITITKSAGEGTSGYHIPGDTVTYTITVRNSDTAFDASLVTISDNIPPEVVYNAGSLSCPDVSFDPQWFTAAVAWAAADTSSATAVRCFEGDVLKAPAAGTPTEATMSFNVDIP